MDNGSPHDGHPRTRRRRPAQHSPRTEAPVTEILVEPDPFDVRRVPRATGLLREFNDAGVLVASDVHVALRLAALAGENDNAVLLAAALAVRAPRIGHV